MATVDHPDVLQAQYFIVELERSADTLVEQITRLQRRVGGKRDADRRLAELHNVRRQLRPYVVGSPNRSEPCHLPADLKTPRPQHE